MPKSKKAVPIKDVTLKDVMTTAKAISPVDAKLETEAWKAALKDFGFFDDFIGKMVPLAEAKQAPTAAGSTLGSHSQTVTHTFLTKKDIQEAVKQLKTAPKLEDTWFYKPDKPQKPFVKQVPIHPYTDYVSMSDIMNVEGIHKAKNFLASRNIHVDISIEGYSMASLLAEYTRSLQDQISKMQEAMFTQAQTKLNTLVIEHTGRKFKNI